MATKKDTFQTHLTKAEKEIIENVEKTRHRLTTERENLPDP